MNNKIWQISLLITMLSIAPSILGSWTDNHDINAQLIFNNGEPATIRVDTTFGLNLSQQVVYNLLCLALGVTGSGITYSGIQELVKYNQDENNHNNDNTRLVNKIGWRKTSIGLVVTIGSLIGLFQYHRLNKLFDTEFIIINHT